MSLFFFFNDTATTEIYTLSLHDALPISERGQSLLSSWRRNCGRFRRAPRIRGNGQQSARNDASAGFGRQLNRSEEHTSELQSQSNLVCRLLLEKKKKIEHSYCFGLQEAV